MSFKIIFVFLLTFILSGFVCAEEHTISQKNKAFSEETIKIKKGDKVTFVNEDDFFHNVFSLSDIKFFDLGSYPKNESKSVVFEEAGVIDVECAIHPEMTMTIKVSN